jgi:hypothetical protein
MKKQILISIDDDHLGRMPAVVEALQGRGLEVRRTLPALGVVSGAAEEAELPSLRGVEGVNSLEEEKESTPLTPPDPPTQ